MTSSRHRNVTSLFAGPNHSRPKQGSPWLRRQALQLAAQLPEDEGEARCVVHYLEELLDGFLSGRSDGD